MAELASPDAITAFLTKLGYDTADRTLLSPEAVGLSGESASAIKKIELLSEDPEQFLRVVFAQPKSLTAKVRNDLVRVLGKSNLDHLLILASDFDTLEFVFLDKRKREQKGPVGGERIQVVPKTFKRRPPASRRRSNGASCGDSPGPAGMPWSSSTSSAAFSTPPPTPANTSRTGACSPTTSCGIACGTTRPGGTTLRRCSPSSVIFCGMPRLAGAARTRTRCGTQLLEPLFKKLGFKATVNRPSKTDQTQPDYLLKSGDGGKLTAAFVYAWDRWLDGPDLNDTDTPEENPGACVVTALDAGTADWIIVTNGRLWRLYSRQAHARATNFYEVDLVEALTASGDTDPNEAFRYWWLFLRPVALRADRPKAEGCWLDDILLGSREYAKRLGDRLKDRIFLTIFPHLAEGFLVDRKQRLGQNKGQTEEELADIFEATLTLLYRLLFLLYAESRDLLPIREAPYQAASFKKIKDEIADKAGVAESDVAERLEKAYSPKETALYDRLCKLFVAMDKGDPILNVPTYNGGLFNTKPDKSDRREQRIARFLAEHKVPDRYLALAIDRLARDQDERTLALVFIDYKSLEVRHLGSIYEGLLEFKLKVAEEDLTTQADKKGETYIALSQAKVKRGKQAAIVVQEERSLPLQRQGRAEGVGIVLHARPHRRVHRRQHGRPGAGGEAGSAAARVPQGPQDVRQRTPEIAGATPARQSSTAGWTTPLGRAADVQRPQGPGGAALRPAGARPGDGQRPLPGRDGRFRHRPSAQVPQPVPDQPGELRPGPDPRRASWNPSVSRASPSIPTS